MPQGAFTAMLARSQVFSLDPVRAAHDGTRLDRNKSAPRHCRVADPVARVADFCRSPQLNRGMKPDNTSPTEPSSARHSADAYLSLKALASYSGLGVRTLRDLLTQPTRPVPHYRMAGKILVKRSEFDAWMRDFHAVHDRGADDLVAEILRRL